MCLCILFVLTMCVCVCVCVCVWQAYLIACVWNCYRYVSGRGTTEILVYVTTNDTAVSYTEPASGSL